ncbi:MAG: ABC transporter ATP-binding protein [Candidatus Limivicinus sp.]|nr:ABC transporter ATP-binding protein [Candidatus Limivicinus sp.]
MEPYLYTARLAVGYGGKPLIENICLHVRRGEIMTLIGPNGAGKSTILKTLARQLTPMAGAVYLDKQALGQMAEKELAQRLAIVTTERIDPELMTCRDIVSTGRYPYTGRLGLLRAEDRTIVENAMAQVHAGELAELPFAQVSDGQRQRVLLARALCQQPDVILLDEPTSFLDIHHKLELLDILKNLVRQQGLAVVMSLHELDLAQRVSDIVVCVEKSGALRMGPPEQIFTEENIRALYGLTQESYNPLFGCAELPPVQGEPQIFVIGGGGSGIPVYRRLQRLGVPFAAGILHRNDLDYPVARALAAELVEEAAYQPVTAGTLARALAVLERCGKAVCTLPAFGPLNEANRLLWEAAKQNGKQVDWNTV